MTKYIYTFGGGEAEGKASMKELLGGKGSGLAEMCRLGLPVPPGFTLTTEACLAFGANPAEFLDTQEKEIVTAISHVETIMGARFGDVGNPLLLSVRSGARESMPGMMDTILNVGLNTQTVKGLAAQSGDKPFAEDSFRRLKEMFRDVVGKPLPNDPKEQLWEGIKAVFQSWNSKRAIEYRRIHRIPHTWGTGCNVQAMVFGNMGETSGTGVAFTRDPSTGEKKFFGEYLINAQGEDVVAGIRTPEPLEKLKEKLPESYAALEKIYHKLEKHYLDMQDMEFTVQKGKLWMLQTRRGKRTAKAAVKIAVDMVGESLIGKEEALMRVEPAQIDQLLHPMISPRVRRNTIAKGLGASPGAAVGKVVFTADDAVVWTEKQEPVILVRQETSPDDIHGMNAAKGILTCRGGMTSHAAVVARGMGKVCVAGCGAVQVDPVKKEFRVNGTVVKEGEWLTIDGTTGEVMLGQLPTEAPQFTEEFNIFMTWADGLRRLKVRANADTPKDAAQAVQFGAEGIGLCRTEHMFFAKDRIRAMRQMILAENKEERCNALAKLEPMQRQDFYEIFKVMKGKAVTVRLLDPPLHEFLPREEEELHDLSCEMGLHYRVVKAKVETLQEENPMLGFRGCRLGIVYPEIYEMQVRAIMEAASRTQKEGMKTVPEIELPLIGLRGELIRLRALVENVCKQVIAESKQKIEYKIGTMVEVPRAAFRSDALAPYADFLSFGTNDLTQTTMGISRDDGYKFLSRYEELGLVRTDPFESIDFNGVGELMKICVEKARRVKPKMEIGICGEHGGEPESIYFCHNIGLDYVSCSPFRVPIARLAAARAVLLEREKN